MASGRSAAYQARISAVLIKRVLQPTAQSRNNTVRSAAEKFSDIPAHTGGTGYGSQQSALTLGIFFHQRFWQLFFRQSGFHHAEYFRKCSLAINPAQHGDKQWILYGVEFRHAIPSD